MAAAAAARIYAPRRNIRLITNLITRLLQSLATTKRIAALSPACSEKALLRECHLSGASSLVEFTGVVYRACTFERVYIVSASTMILHDYLNVYKFYSS